MFRLYLLLALTSQLPAADAIKDAAAKRGIHFGAAVQSGYIANEPAFATTLLREFSMVEPEWEMLWSAIHPSQNTYNFTGADAIVAYAASNNMPVRADHPVCDRSCVADQRQLHRRPAQPDPARPHLRRGRTLRRQSVLLGSGQRSCGRWRRRIEIGR